MRFVNSRGGKLMEFSGPIFFFPLEILGGPISRVPWGVQKFWGGPIRVPWGGPIGGPMLKSQKLGGVQCSNSKSWGGPDPPNPCGGCAYARHHDWSVWS